LLVLILCASCLLAADAYAFDGKRKGFFVGLGMGGGVVDYSATSVVQTSTGPVQRSAGDDVTGAFTIDFRMGGGVNERLMVYYLSRIPWFENPDGRKSGSLTTGFVGAAASWHFRATPGGFYVVLGLGWQSWSKGFPVGSAESRWGMGALAGLGWEFGPHFPLELTVHGGKPESEEYGFPTTAEILSVNLTISGWMY
jgi:hypothetical protein